MSYIRICLRSESNQRHGDFQSPALPTELQRRIKFIIVRMTTRMGLEPTTSSVTGWRSKPTELPGQVNGDNRTRTCDSLLVRQVLYQLSYAPASVRQFPLHCSCHRSSSDRGYYTPGWAVCQPLFLIFLFFFLSAFTPKKNKKTNKGKWAIRDSNPGPTGYEPVALTN